MTALTEQVAARLSMALTYACNAQDVRTTEDGHGGYIVSCRAVGMGYAAFHDVESAARMFQAVCPDLFWRVCGW